MRYRAILEGVTQVNEDDNMSDIPVTETGVM
jgi:hypothetical protein